jgi:hypothetical protein
VKPHSLLRSVGEEPLEGRHALRLSSLAPVQAWAVVGGACLVFEAYILGSWLLSGRVKPTPTRPSPVPTWMEWTIHGYEVLGIGIGGAFIYSYLVKPWRREGHITLDGLLTLVFLSMYWQDLLLNYFKPWVIYNSAAINIGSWFGNVPGWNWPNGNRMVEPFLWVFPVYAYIMLGLPILGCYVMRRARDHWTRLGRLSLAGLCFVVFVAIDLILEPGMMRLGLFQYGGGIRSLTIFYGHYYQFPLYEAFWFPFVLTIWASIRFNLNDNGHTLAESGIDQIRIGGKQRTTLRFLALAGLFNATFLVCYEAPLAVIQIKSSVWPQDIQRRSYLTDDICGPRLVVCLGQDPYTHGPHS